MWHWMCLGLVDKVVISPKLDSVLGVFSDLNDSEMENNAILMAVQQASELCPVDEQ